ncbi:hypothetical protein D3C81_1832590 [compost metagenome]
MVKYACSLASCTTSWPIKSASPRRLTGMFWIKPSRRSAGTAARTAGDSIGPGAMALTVTPAAANSLAKILVRVTMAPLDAA